MRALQRIALAALASQACSTGGAPEQGHAATPGAPQPPDPAWQAPLGAELRELATGHAGGFERFDSLRRGELGERERAGLLAVLPYGHCYRFLAVASASLRDLDLRLLDPHGVEIQRDTEASNTVVLGEAASICPNDAGAYRLEVHARAGAGSYVVAYFRDRL